jgi:DNA-binding HxlR family transcriptional regulator
MPAFAGSKRLAYRLTAKGNALRPVLEAMGDCETPVSEEMKR